MLTAEQRSLLADAADSGELWDDMPGPWCGPRIKRIAATRDAIAAALDTIAAQAATIKEQETEVRLMHDTINEAGKKLGAMQRTIAAQAEELARLRAEVALLRRVVQGATDHLRAELGPDADDAYIEWRARFAGEVTTGGPAK